MPWKQRLISWFMIREPESPTDRTRRASFRPSPHSWQSGVAFAQRAAQVVSETYREGGWEQPGMRNNHIPEPRKAIDRAYLA